MTKVAIMGAGEMGAWFAKQYASKGLEILMSDNDFQKAQKVAFEVKGRAGDAREMIPLADEIVIATSLDSIEKVIQDNRGSLRSKKLYDISSIKNGIPDLLGEVSDHSFSLHPMWGGATDSFRGQNAILVPTRNLNDAVYEQFFEGFKKRFIDYGCNVGVLTSEQHDRMMAWEIGLPHYLHVINGGAKSMSGIDRAHGLKFEGTTARLTHVATESVVNSDPKFYREIQQRNPYMKDVRRTFLEVSTMLDDDLSNGKGERFEDMMRAAKEYFMAGEQIETYLPRVKQEFVVANRGVLNVRNGSLRN